MTRTQFARQLATGAVTAALLAPFASRAQSQVSQASQPGDPRWEAWLGCWESVPAATSDSPVRAVVCVKPVEAAKTAVEIATIGRGKVIARDTIDASGAQRSISPAGCTGWQRADWSKDERRVYVRSEVSCGSSVKRTSTGVIAMSSTDDWIDIQGASANGHSGVRITRYREVGPGYIDLPAEFADVITGRARTPYAARSVAGSPVGASDVIEAASQLDTLVVQAWLIARGQRFELNAQQLVAMASAGVPGSVTDVMIGVSYPEHFSLEPQGAAPIAAGGAWPVQPGRGLGVLSTMSTRMAVDCYNGVPPLWYTRYDYDPCAYGYGYQYGYGYGYGYGTSAYGYPGYYGFGTYGYYGPFSNAGYMAPVINVRGNEPPHGRAINGQGYTRGSSSDGSYTMPDPLSEFRSTMRSPSGGSTSSGSASSGAAARGSSTGSSGSTGRTAQARPPGGKQ